LQLIPGLLKLIYVGPFPFTTSLGRLPVLQDSVELLGRQVGRVYMATTNVEGLPHRPLLVHVTVVLFIGNEAVFPFQRHVGSMLLG